MVDFSVSTEIIPSNRSSKYDEVIDALRRLRDGQHLQVNGKDDENAENISNAIRSAAKLKGMKLSVTKRGSTLYIRVNKG